MQFNYIQSNPAILNGKPCIKNTRISVDIIIEWLANGATVNDVLLQYPQLNQNAVNEALLYAANYLKNDAYFEVKVA